MNKLFIVSVSTTRGPYGPSVDMSYHRNEDDARGSFQERIRTRITCEETGKSFTISHDGQRCACGQMFNLVGQRITHRGY